VLETYFNYLIEQNKIHNLTAITDRDEVWVKHFEDSLAAADLIPRGAKVLDIGAGAGFPSVPLKIKREDINVTMLDSVRKKVDFLNNLVELLGLSDIKAIHTRIEDFIPSLRGKAEAIPCKDIYNVCVARAVAKLNVLCEYALPFVKVGGIFIAYKSVEIDKELEEASNAIKILGGELKEIKDYSLKFGERKLIVIKKTKPTPPEYPRGGNKPRLKPL